MKWKTTCVLMLAVLLAMAPALAEPATDDLTALAKRYVPLIGRSETELSAELGQGALRQDDAAHEAVLDAKATLAGEAYDIALLYNGELLYGVRFTRGGLDGQGAADCAQALVEMARARYGAPATYPIEQTDKSVREYWYFARPKNLVCEIAATGADESGYAVHVQFALSALPGVEYALGDQVAPYMEMLGNDRADVCAAAGLSQADAEPEANGAVELEPVMLLDGEFDRALLFDADDDTLCGIAYVLRGADAMGMAGKLYAQAEQEYGMQYTSSADVPFRQALASLENGSELDVGWRLPVADGSLPGVNVELATCVDDEGIGHVRLTYSLVDDA